MRHATPRRITRIDNLEDTQKLAAALERIAAAGLDEARADAITDRDLVVPVAPATPARAHAKA